MCHENVCKSDCERVVVRVSDTRVEVRYHLYTNGEKPEPRVVPELTEHYRPQNLAIRRQAAEAERELLEPGNWNQERVRRMALLADEDALLDEIEGVMNAST